MSGESSLPLFPVFHSRRLLLHISVENQVVLGNPEYTNPGPNLIAIHTLGPFLCISIRIIHPKLDSWVAMDYSSTR
jgi:hypothetical protein